MTWTLKETNAADRRISKLAEEGVTVDMNSHEFRTKLGYNYVEYLTSTQDDEEES